MEDDTVYTVYKWLREKEKYTQTFLRKRPASTHLIQYASFAGSLRSLASGDRLATHDSFPSAAFDLGGWIGLPGLELLEDGEVGAGGEGVESFGCGLGAVG